MAPVVAVLTDDVSELGCVEKIINVLGLNLVQRPYGYHLCFLWYIYPHSY